METEQLPLSVSMMEMPSVVSRPLSSTMPLRATQLFVIVAEANDDDDENDVIIINTTKTEQMMMSLCIIIITI